MAKKVLQTKIEIEASPERVWQILTDFHSFPEWNPFIRRVVGEAQEGAILEVYIEPSGSRGMTFRPTVLKAEPGRELRWLGRLYMPGLFDGEHVFTIEPVNEKRVRFTQREVFSGLLVPALAARLEEGTWRGFREMNKALKDRAEQGQEEEQPV
ncbi:MAG TPA: SRPBCC domain-containing protein [Anaerolineales bacterium]